MISIAWHVRAACLYEPTESFYVDEEEEPGKIAALRLLCERCDAIDDCRTHALTWEQHGFWAGMTENERTAEARRLRITRRSLRTARPT